MSKKSKKLLIGLVALALLVWLLPHIVNAQTFDIKKGIVGNLSADCQKYGNCGFCDWIDLFVILQKVILSLFGGIALILMVWAGQGLITAAGNETKIKESKKLIGTTIIGILVVLAGYFLVNVIIGVLFTPAGTTTGLLTSLKDGTSWAQAYCRQPTDANFCQNRTGGTPCVIQGISGYCSDTEKKCITACDYKLGGNNSGYTCRNITTCAGLSAISDLQDKIDACTGTEAGGGDNKCAKFLCPGDNTNVCCTNN